MATREEANGSAAENSSSNNHHNHNHNPNAPPLNPPSVGVPPYAVPPQEAEHRSMSSSSCTLFMATGAVVGLTAAAAVRWLNGGDFCLFPPAATTPPPPRTATPPSAEEPPSSSNDELRQDMKALVEALRDQSQQQQTLVQQLVRRDDSRLVDESMSLLRRQEEDQTRINGHVVDDKMSRDNRLVVQELNQVLSELNLLKQDLSVDDSAVVAQTSAVPRLEKVIQTLQGCLKVVPPPTTTTSLELSNPSMETAINTSLSTTPSPVSKLMGATAADSSNATTAETTTGLAALSSALQRLVHANAPAQWRQGVPLLYLYVHNLERHPHMPRYRKIFTSNESFARKIAPLQGGIDVLRAVGFVQQQPPADGQCWEWLPDQADNDGGAVEAEHLEYLREAASALQVLQQQSSYSNNNNSSDSVQYSPPRAPSSASSSPSKSPPAVATAAASSAVRFVEDGCPHTPDPSIKSPPIPKKQIFPKLTTSSARGSDTEAPSLPPPPPTPNCTPTVVAAADDDADYDLAETSTTNAIWK